MKSEDEAEFDNAAKARSEEAVKEMQPLRDLFRDIAALGERLKKEREQPTDDKASKALS